MTYILKHKSCRLTILHVYTQNFIMRIFLISKILLKQKKVFNCPANLASHRRWHKPRQGSLSNKSVMPGTVKQKQKPVMRSNENINNSDCQVGNFVCKDCGKAFRRLVICHFTQIANVTFCLFSHFVLYLS